MTNVYGMDPIKVTFVISQIPEEDVSALKNNRAIVSKMILCPDDYKLFHYKEKDVIQVETQNGNRLWCEITHLEVVEREERVILIFTLEYAEHYAP